MLSITDGIGVAEEVREGVAEEVRERQEIVAACEDAHHKL